MQTLEDLAKVERTLQISLKQLEKEKGKGKANQIVILKSEIQRTRSQISNLEAFSRLNDGMIVRHKNRTADNWGVVFELMRTPGGMGQAWVSWSGGVAVPEQPELLTVIEDSKENVSSTVPTTTN